MHHLTRFLLLFACATPLVWFAGCATEEIPKYGDPAKLVGGAGPGSGASSASSSGGSSGGTCTPDPACMVSFSKDVFPILENKAKCSAGECHAPAASQVPALASGDVAGQYQTLITHVFLADPSLPEDKYIVPCSPETSKMMCNLKLDPAWGMNMFGSCAPRMPKVSANDAVQDAPLSLDELNKIAEWITCGAPNN